MNDENTLIYAVYLRIGFPMKKSKITLTLILAKFDSFFAKMRDSMLKSKAIFLDSLKKTEENNFESGRKNETFDHFFIFAFSRKCEKFEVVSIVFDTF